MSSNSTTRFNRDTYAGQRKFTARNTAYSFDLFDDEWKLGLKEKVKLDWMHDVAFDEQSFISLRLVFAKMAKLNAPSSVNIAKQGIKKLNAEVTKTTLRLRFSEIQDCYKKSISNFLNFAVKHGFDEYESAANYAKEQVGRIKSISGANILDPYKGVYSELEYQSIKEQIRLDTDKHLSLALTKDKNYTRDDLHGLGITVAIQLKVVVMRRETQLVKMKWCDILPVGAKFADHRVNKNEEVPTHEPTFSDVETLHIRTFRGKTGGFRVDAERSSHRVEPDVSRLVLLYRQKYEAWLTKKLSSEGIVLTPAETKEIMARLPVLFSKELFSPSTIFNNTATLFKATGRQSESFHKSNVILSNNIIDRCRKLNFRSDRIDPDALKFSNNRLRHHVLTESTMRGESGPALANITGVTEKAIKPYIELNFEARLLIDQALANHQVLSNFASQSVSELQKQDGFIVLSEYDEELGVQKNPSSCSGCQSRLGAPMGCYGCDNFHPDLHANHEQILDKATAKYEVNLAASNAGMLRKLSKCILYIQATINVCNDKINSERGVCDDRN
jgi:hypothetical protein